MNNDITYTTIPVWKLVPGDRLAVTDGLDGNVVDVLRVKEVEVFDVSVELLLVSTPVRKFGQERLLNVDIGTIANRLDV
jgi:hypothetical protein